MATVQAGKCVSCAEPFTTARRVCCSAAFEARYVLENGDEEHHHTDPVCQECCLCGGAKRIEALESVLRRLCEACSDEAIHFLAAGSPELAAKCAHEILQSRDAAQALLGAGEGADGCSE